MDFTIVAAKPNAINAVASSSATTLISMEVIGPLALYCLITIMVCAGAVAAAIAPRRIESGAGKPNKTQATITTATAPKLSRQAMTNGAAPTFLK